MRRGLLTTRSLSLAQHRVRGVQLRRTLPLRWAGAATTQVIATGLTAAAGDGPRPVAAASVLPPAPLAHVHRTVAALLADAVSPLQDAVWRPHPRAALTRRLLRAVVATVVVGTVVTLGPMLTGRQLGWAPTLLIVVATAGAGAALAVDAWRGLGHGLRGRYLLIRSGTWSRTSVAVRRDAVIGWRIGTSPDSVRQAVRQQSQAFQPTTLTGGRQSRGRLLDQ